MCKRLFLSTLAISGQWLNNALSVNNGNNVGIAPKEIKARNKNPSRGFKWDLGDQDFLEEFFRIVPKAEGHYCRKDSKKIYLSQVVPTMSKLYSIYKARFAAMGRIYFSIWEFTEHFKDKNYSLFKRKKDLCNVCLGYKEGNIEEMYVEHIQRKEDVLELKEKDKCSADNISKFVITTDTEALSLAPSSDANVMFFHSKLNVHNFTFFDLKTKDVMNYLWTEVNGLIESDKFISCYKDYLNDLLY